LFVGPKKIQQNSNKGNKIDNWKLLMSYIPTYPNRIK